MQIYIDEAGRGPLAGPLYVGLIIVHQPITKKIITELTIRDSKQLSHNQREKAYHGLLALADQGVLSGTVASVNAEEIDQLGVTKAINTAITRGLEKLCKGEELFRGDHELIIDGKSDFGLKKSLGVNVKTIVHGDALVPEISMASILAKVSRDREMIERNTKYPLYGFDQHKGYGTQRHQSAIIKYGPCPIHRRLFLRKLLNLENILDI